MAARKQLAEQAAEKPVEPFEQWLTKQLMGLYDSAAQEPIPDEWVQLIRNYKKPE